EAPAAELDLAAAPEADLGALDGAFDAAAAIAAAAYPPPDAEPPPAASGPAAQAPPAEPFADSFAGAFAEPPAGPEPLAAAELGQAAAAPLFEGEPFAEEAPPLPAPEPASAPAPFAPAPLQVHEPEPAVSYEPGPAADLGLPPEIAAAYGAAGADTFELPPAVADGLFDAAPAPEPLEVEPLPPPAPSVAIEGTHRVVLHTVDGQVKRGLLVDALLDAPALPLQAQGAGAAEEIPTEGIKAIFFMLAPGEKAPAPEGRKVRVTFRDGRQVAGFSPDYHEGLVGFFMIPADTRTNTGRIWVYQSAVKSVAVS
ncbi:MAG: chemotaxis protein CheA, partial [Anaeromyxobacteraceae bacterium]|nr:chemotaxis protein CheA [Anaeromyxobacteraceae bacterium]